MQRGSDHFFILNQSMFSILASLYHFMTELAVSSQILLNVCILFLSNVKFLKKLQGKLEHELSEMLTLLDSV